MVLYKPIPRSLPDRPRIKIWSLRGHKMWFAVSRWFGCRLVRYKRWGGFPVVEFPRAIQRRGRMPKRPEIAASIAAQAKAFDSTSLAKKYPVLASYLSDLYYEVETGKEPVPRKPSSVFLFPGNGFITAVLKESSTGLQLRVQVTSLELVWGALEQLLSSVNTPWEPDANPVKGKPKRSG